MTSPATSLPRSVVEGELSAASHSGANERFKPGCANVLGVQVEAVDISKALAQILDALIAGRKGYICMAGVHGIMEAQRSAIVMRAFSDSLMNLPDGMPTVWIGRSQRFTTMRRVTGADVMLQVLGSRQFAKYSHFFYGGKPGIAQELALEMKRRFPWVRIAGTYTPPFRDLSDEEYRELTGMVRSAKPSIIWVGISTPRQELFMQKYLPTLDTCLMFGVGAAFDFHTGRIKDCSEWIKLAGLQWLHRLFQDPRHLLWRYARNNPAFMWQIVTQVIKAGRRRPFDSRKLHPTD